jgi:hypothetical protein
LTWHLRARFRPSCFFGDLWQDGEFERPGHAAIRADDPGIECASEIGIADGKAFGGRQAVAGVLAACVCADDQDFAGALADGGGGLDLAEPSRARGPLRAPAMRRGPPLPSKPVIFLIKYEIMYYSFTSRHNMLRIAFVVECPLNARSTRHI